MADDRNTFDPARLADWKRKSPAPWTPGFAFAAGADGWARPEASPISPAGRSDPYIPRKATSLRDCGAAASRRKLAPQPLPAAILIRDATVPLWVHHGQAGQCGNARARFRAHSAGGRASPRWRISGVGS